MPGGPTNKIMGLRGLWREVKGLESLGVSHSPSGGRGGWKAGTLEILKLRRLRFTYRGANFCTRWPHASTTYTAPSLVTAMSCASRNCPS
jgi:hypothetical protein